MNFEIVEERFSVDSVFRQVCGVAVSAVSSREKGLWM